ncbi:MAG: glycosyltransferase family 39 protein [Acidobacteria bacterium]|nr:glycosyltransferase family 39 protein [Acidobacteriota bacterium]
MTRRALLSLAFLFLVTALVIVISGGFVTSVLDRRVSARSPAPAAAAAVLAAASWLVAARRGRAVIADLDWTWTVVERRAPALVAAIAATSAALAVRFGTFSATGSDASGYLSEAALLWSRSLSYAEPLHAFVDWADGASTLVPSGWRSGLTAGTQVPSYAPGLPLLMAIPYGIAGTLGACLVSAIAAGLGVWTCARLAMNTSRAAGVLAAACLATSPTYLVQSFQPMSDVPATAAWTACWLLLARGTRAASVPDARALLLFAGMLAALAVMIRPNLAPLASLPAAYLLVLPAPSSSVRVNRILAFSIPVAVAGLVVAGLHWRWYGSPLMSGYGGAGELYATAHVKANVTRYAGWLLAIESPLLLAAPLAAWRPRGSLWRWCLAFALVTAFGYCLYLVVEQWTYLRFLLPAIAIGVAAASAVVTSAADRLPSWSRGPALALLILAVTVHGVVNARRLGVFSFADVHARAILAGHYLDTVLPARAVIVAGEQSGSIRYYTGRSIVRWDLILSGQLQAVLDTLVRAGHEPWIALDAWEDEPFRQRHGDVPAGSLDWPPALDAGREMRTRAWRVSDRERFMEGTLVRTDRVRR